MIKKYLIILLCFYVYSCEKNSFKKNNTINNSQINISFSKSDLSLINSDSLSVNFKFENPDSSFVKVNWYTKSSLSGEFNFTTDSLNNISRNIPISEDTDSLFIEVLQNDRIINHYKISIPKRDIKNVFIISDKKSNFNELIKANRLFKSEVIKNERFKKYSFSSYDILVIENINYYSDNLIREIQKFMLLQKPILIMMSDFKNDKLFLSQTLDFPDIKAIRGTSKNQFFSLKSEYPEKYLSNNYNDFQIFRFFELKNVKDEEVYFSISTNDPLVVKKKIFGSDILFVATQLDKNWTNNFFNEFVYDIFLELVYDQVVLDES
tara:strand:- start:2776 stop:3741 length:966 start_codon:yes stop_codon:yes gene_type:complete